MALVQRRYEGEEDYWRIREFLRQVFLLSGRREVCWQAEHWDSWRWHGVENLGYGSLEDNVFLWEEQSGEIAAVEQAGESLAICLGTSGSDSH